MGQAGGASGLLVLLPARLHTDCPGRESGGAGQIPAWKPQGGAVDVLPFATFVFHKGVRSVGVRLL